MHSPSHPYFATRRTLKPCLGFFCLFSSFDRWSRVCLSSSPMDNQCVCLHLCCAMADCHLRLFLPDHLATEINKHVHVGLCAAGGFKMVVKCACFGGKGISKTVTFVVKEVSRQKPWSSALWKYNLWKCPGSNHLADPLSRSVEIWLLLQWKILYR